MRQRPIPSRRIEPAASDWKHELALIDSSYGRLVYLTGLLDPNTGLYEYSASKSTKDGESVHRVLKQAHEDLFREWVSFSLQRKRDDIDSYIAGLGLIDKAQLVNAWARLTPYKFLVPAAIQGPERHKHVSDVAAILRLLQNVYGVPDQDQTA